MHANVVAKQLHRISQSDLPAHAPVDAVVVTSKMRSWLDVSGKLGGRMGKAQEPALLESRKERRKNITTN